MMQQTEVLAARRGDIQSLTAICGNERDQPGIGTGEFSRVADNKVETDILIHPGQQSRGRLDGHLLPALAQTYLFVQPGVVDGHCGGTGEDVSEHDRRTSVRAVSRLLVCLGTCAMAAPQLPYGCLPGTLRLFVSKREDLSANEDERIRPPIDQCKTRRAL